MRTIITPSMDRDKWMLARLSGERAYDEKLLDDLITECCRKSGTIRQLTLRNRDLHRSATAGWLAAMAFFVLAVIQGCSYQ